MRWDPNKPPPTVHEFDKKLVEADAYLQILIDQIKVRTLAMDKYIVIVSSTRP
jgi:hypothetical protein